MRKRAIAAILSALALSIFIQPADSQTTFGSIEGTITDSSGAPIAGVAVTAANPETGINRVVTNDAHGFYRISNLPSASYRVSVTAKGFATAVHTVVRLDINQTGVINLTLQPSAVEQSVDVDANVSEVNTVTSEVGSTISTKQVNDIPLNGRSFDQLLALIPGAAPAGSATLGFTVNGMRAGANNFLINGTDGNNNYFAEQINGHSGVTFTSLGSASVDDIQEFRVVTNTYSAEYGRVAGAQVNVVTKSGTNSFHGTGYEFARDATLQARNYFADPTQPKPDFRRNQFGGTIGGPVKRNKSFFFFGYEGLRQKIPVTTRGLVPTDLFRVQAPAIWQPYLQYLPKPTQPLLDATGATNPYAGYITVTVSQVASENAETMQFDHQFSDKDSLTVHYHEDQGTVFQPGTLNQLTGTGQAANNHIANITETHIFNASTLNEVRLGFNRGPRNFYYAPTGFSGLPATLATATISSPGLTLGATPNYSYYPTTAYQAVDSLSLTRGVHRLRVGVDIRRIGEVFNNGPSLSATYLSVADFFANSPFTVASQNVNPSKSFGFTTNGVYVQDDIKLTRRFNVNVGVRYEYNTPVAERHDRQSSYVVAEHNLEVGQPLYKAQKTNFAPRIGFAWDVTGDGKTSIRSGYGIFYDSINPTELIFQALNPPLVQNVSVSRSLNPTLTFPLPATITPSQLTPTVYGFDPNIKLAMLQQFNFNVQRQVIKDTVLQVGYVGSRGTHLLRNQDVNRIDPLTKVRPDPRYASIIVRQGTAQSWYHSLQVSLERRYTSGLSYGLAYTWAHSTDDASSSYDNGQNMACLKCEYGNSTFDRRHNFVGNAVYNLPFGRGAKFGSSWNGITNSILGGWQMNGILSIRSALPFSVVGLPSDVRGDGSPATQRPNLVLGVSPYLPNGSPTGFLNKAAFTLPAPGTYGNLGRNVFRGPNFGNLDYSLFKNFTMPWFGKERSTVQFRAEAFNILNHPNLSTPVGTFSSATFGTIIATLPTGSDGRQLQLAVKFIF